MKRYEAPFDLYNVILGAFLFVSPWLFAFGYAPARESAFASGALLVLISLLAIVAFREWQEWINLAIGCWILSSPWILGFPHTSSMHVAAAVGAIVVYLSLTELWLIHNPGWTKRVYTLQPQASRPHRGGER
jgi:hypothetical protein